MKLDLGKLALTRMTREGTLSFFLTKNRTGIFFKKEKKKKDYVSLLLSAGIDMTLLKQIPPVLAHSESKAKYLKISLYLERA